jgi:SH3-like domain-containing protein
LAVLAAVQAVRFFKGNLTVGLKVFRIFLIIAIALLGTVFYFQNKEFTRTKLVILDTKASVRFGPSDKEAQAFELHEGAMGAVLDETERWYFIWLANGQAGWVKRESGQIV